MSDAENICCPVCKRPMAGFCFGSGFNFEEVLSGVGMRHKISGINLDFRKFTAIRDGGESVKITKSMWKYLAVLISSRGRVVSRDELYTRVYGGNAGMSRSVDTFVSMLRGLFGALVFRAVFGVGFIFAPGCSGVFPEDRRFRDYRSPVRKKVNGKGRKS